MLYCLGSKMRLNNLARLNSAIKTVMRQLRSLRPYRVKTHQDRPSDDKIYFGKAFREP